jgi:O-succinylbenzoic acid--CoA ligase
MENSMFDLKEHQILLASAHQNQAPLILKAIKDHLPTKHYIILSSGTTGEKLKGYALSEEALLANARAVNNFYNIDAKDVWALSLPQYHVGGLSVLARAHLLGNKVILTPKWNATSWIKTIDQEKVSLSTIVPTQLFDLVQFKLQPPKSLRALIVGGDFMSDELEAMGLRQGWPIYRTFGMTEVCSQLASSRILGSKKLEILPIHKAQVIDERLLVKSESLFTLQLTIADKIEVHFAREYCNKDNFLITQDMAELENNTLIPLGRVDEKIKISGRLYDLLDIRNVLEKVALELNEFKKVEVSVEQDERKGQKLILNVLKDVKDKSPYLKALLPLVPDEIIYHDEYLRTDLGKLKKLR